MEIEGIVIADLGKQEGTSKAGNHWQKREYVLETLGNYPRKVKFHIFGDKADSITFNIGQRYVCSFDLESREFNGRWYTDVSVFAARPADAPAAAPGQYEAPVQPNFGAAPAAAPTAAPGAFGADDNTDDLPF